MLRLIEAATVKPVTLAELKKHCRVDHSDDDDTLDIYLAAAIEFVSDRTSLVLAPATYRIERCDWWGGCLNVLVAPVRDVRSVNYLDPQGVPQEVADTLYRWTRTDEGAILELLSAFTSPAVFADRRDAVTIEILAGFDDPNETGTGDDPELALPLRAKQAVLLIAAAWYEGREAVGAGDMKPIPFAADALLGQLRIFR